MHLIFGRSPLGARLTSKPREAEGRHFSGSTGRSRVFIKTICRFIKSLSLIEVCVAIALLAMVLGSMVSLFGQGFMAGKKTKDKAIVYNLLREELENKSTKSLFPLTSSDNISWGNVTGFPGFARQVNCSAYPGYPSNLSMINVTVGWECNATGGNCSKNMTVRTLQAIY